MMEEDNQAPQFDPENPPKKYQVESNLMVALGGNPLELKGCLKIASNPHLFDAFDDIVDIEFSRPLLYSLTPPTLSFMD